MSDWIVMRFLNMS